MTEKLRRIRLERRTFELKQDREWLEPIKLYSYSMTEENRKKGLRAEEMALEHYLNPLLQGKLPEPKLDGLFDMRYSDELTDYNTRLMNALRGIDFNEILDYEPYSKRIIKEHPERKYEVTRLVRREKKNDGKADTQERNLLEELRELVKGNEEALKIIDELDFRFKGLDGYQFKHHLGTLLGSKFDWMGVRDGITILYEVKSRFWLFEEEAKIYFRFSNAGIPFFILIWDEDKRELRRFDMKSFKPEKMLNKYGNYTIPRNETIRLFPRESEEPS
jgi:hypothetical protein